MQYYAMKNCLNAFSEYSYHWSFQLALLDLMASRSVLVNGSQPEVAPQVEAYLGAMKKVMRLFRPELNESMLSKVAKGVLNFEVKLNKVSKIVFRQFLITDMICPSSIAWRK